MNDLETKIQNEVLKDRCRTFEELISSDYISSTHDLHVGVQALLDKHILNLDSLNTDELLSLLTERMTWVFNAYPEIEVINHHFIVGNEPAEEDFIIKFPMTDSSTPHQSMWVFAYKNKKLSHGPRGVVSFEPRTPINILHEEADPTKFPSAESIIQMITNKKGIQVISVLKSPRDAALTKIVFQYSEKIYYLFALNERISSEGDIISYYFVTDKQIGFRQAHIWLLKPDHQCFRDTRRLNVMLQKSGSGSISPRLALPASWIEKLGITSKDRGIEASFDGNTISITKSAMAGEV